MAELPGPPSSDRQPDLLAAPNVASESRPEGDTDLFEGPPARRNAIVRFALIVLGVILIFGGVALGPVPVIPGFPLVIAGVLLLAASSGGARRGINRMERWLPVRTRQLLRKALRRRPTETAKPNTSPGSER